MHQETRYDTVFDAQENFRVLMDCIARPGKILTLESDINPPQQLNKGAALVAFALLNGDVTFFNAIGGPEVHDYIRLNTVAVPASADIADFLFIAGTNSVHHIQSANTGDVLYPETASTIVIQVDRILEGKGKDLTMELTGPGIETTTIIGIDGIDPGVIHCRKEKCSEFPLGIDLVITDAFDNIICLPRTTLIQVVDSKGE